MRKLTRIVSGRLAGGFCLAVASFYIALPLTLTGQITYTAAFTQTLSEGGIEYAEEVEEWLHVTIPPEHEYMDYDLVLQNDINDFEVRYRIDPDTDNSALVPLSAEVARLTASIASNDENSEIRIVVPPDSLLQDAFAADRGVIAYFSPKLTYSEKPYGALLTLHAWGHPVVYIVVLYADPAYDPLEKYRNIRFRNDAK
jgi:hypothetical protein